MKKISEKYSILVNIGLIVCSVLLLIFLINSSLKIITQHGKEITVPDFTNMTFEEAKAEASKAGVKVSVANTKYNRQMRKGAVYNQTPKAGASVKRGRMILLTTNTMEPTMVQMPNLIGCQLNQAKTKLSNSSLSIGKLVFSTTASGLIDDRVNQQLYRGKNIKVGASIPSGSPIDLVLSFDPTWQSPVPNLKGWKYIGALDAIHDHLFNVGKVKFDSSVRTYVDSLNAVVVSQTPVSDGKAYKMGKEISIELSLDPEKIDK